MGVTPKTVSRWADSGRLPFVRTTGGHRRYHRSEVDTVLRGSLDPVFGDADLLDPEADDPDARGSAAGATDLSR
jgi:excisionase family DNA binding protein